MTTDNVSLTSHKEKKNFSRKKPKRFRFLNLRFNSFMCQDAVVCACNSLIMDDAMFSHERD